MKTRAWWKNKFLEASKLADAEGYLVRTVLNFKADGGTQKEAEEILYEVWDEHHKPAPGPRSKKQSELEAVCRVITGYCSPANHLFRDNFEERSYYRPIPESVIEP